MMSKKKWFVVLCLYVVYLLLGAGIFFNIQSQEETKIIAENIEQRQEIEELLRKHIHDEGETLFLEKLADYCGKPIDLNMSEIVDKRRWDFYHSLFFVITVVSTIGYGNLAPTTMFGRIFMIFYGLVGIPLNGIVMVTMGGYFGRSFTKLYQRWKSSKMDYDTTRLGLISQIILYMVPGFTFFIFLPAVIMTVFEGWAYDVAVYYSFVSVTTIGFGDYVAGVTNVHDFGAVYYLAYQIFLLIWIVGGLGYAVMVIGFITQAMSSKKMQILEQKITQNIKKTPLRIRQELRSLLQEFLFLRVKRVYKGEFEYVPTRRERSQSCPDLTIYRNMNSPTMTRKRALSECPRSFILHRIQSDTDLQDIDKELTFQQSNGFMQQKDLLLKVVDALGGIEETDEDSTHAYEGFSDAEILASERYGSHPTLQKINSLSNLTAKQRRRAVSEVKSPALPDVEANQDLTWYGQDARRHVEGFRSRQRTFSEPSAEPVKPPQSFLTRIRKRILPTREDKVVNDVERQEPEHWNASGLSPEDRYLRQTSRGRASVMSIQQEAVLEHTSIADFIRALTAITVPETMVPPPSAPKRKLGTAGIYTPTTSPPRLRRMAIRPNAQTRRSSLMAEVNGTPRERRRFSLRPVDENLMVPPPPYTAQPTQQPVTPQTFPATPNRRFSRMANISASVNISPVQRQVSKKDKDDNS